MRRTPRLIGCCGALRRTPRLIGEGSVAGGGREGSPLGEHRSPVARVSW
jgi:hypothetical protein